MHIITKSYLKKYWERMKTPKLTQWLRLWIIDVRAAEWKNFSDIKRMYNSADTLNGNKVAFNVCGNHYRLIVKVEYQRQEVYTIWRGTHDKYDKIDADTVKFKRD